MFQFEAIGSPLLIVSWEILANPVAIEPYSDGVWVSDEEADDFTCICITLIWPLRPACVGWWLHFFAVGLHNVDLLEALS